MLKTQKFSLSKVLIKRGFPTELKEGIISKKDINCMKYSADLVIKDYKLQNDVYAESGWSSRNILELFIKNNYDSVIDSRGQFTKFVIKNSGNIHYLKERQQGYLLSVLRNLGTTQQAGDLLKEMGLKFSFPKPVNLIKFLIKVYSPKEPIILDFFAGSGTTGHAVLDLNKDGGNRKFILCTNNENNICSDVCYPRIKKVIEGYKNSDGEKIEGLGGNLKYFKTGFVDAEPTDKNKIKLTKEATEMLCIKEDTFESVSEKAKFKIFRDGERYTGIILDHRGIKEFKKAIKDIKGEFSIYVFSVGDDTFEEEFEDLEQKFKLSPIPEVILRVYRRIFK